VGRLLRALWTLASGVELRRRLVRLRDRGLITAVPSRRRLLVGGADMLRFFISPAAADYYRQRGIRYSFHQLLRILDDPASMIDPVGLYSQRDTIIGHVLQVTHANPCYDLQLLEAYDDGVAELERQTRAMIDGSHPRATSIGAIIEDAGYHARLLDYIHAFQVDPAAPPPVRENIAASEALAPVERTFGTLPAAFRYFDRVPVGRGAGLLHLLRVREFPLALAEPEGGGRG